MVVRRLPLALRHYVWRACKVLLSFIVCALLLLALAHECLHQQQLLSGNNNLESPVAVKELPATMLAYIVADNKNSLIAAQPAAPATAPDSGTMAAAAAKSRRKRFLAFPLGSSLSCAICMTTGVVGNPNYQYLSMGLNWGIAYDLPNATWVLQTLKGTDGEGADSDDVSTPAPAMDQPDDGGDAATPAPAADASPPTPIFVPVLKRRQRRALYGKLETLLASMGYNGRECVLRALCESRRYFESGKKLTMIGEMLRAVFSLPKQRIFSRELLADGDIAHYDTAYRHARRRAVDCAQAYECDFSLMELAFGKYAQPPPGYYQ